MQPPHADLHHPSICDHPGAQKNGGLGLNQTNMKNGIPRLGYDLITGGSGAKLVKFTTFRKPLWGQGIS